MAKIFVVEDNSGLLDAVVSYLEVEGHTVVPFDRVSGVFEAARMAEPDAIILDVMLPDGDGFHLARKIKHEQDIPILFLTARTSESDRITGLEIGADDYVTKPFSPRELRARIKAVLRRTENQKRENNSNSEVYDFSNFKFKLDNDDKSVSINNQIISFAPREFELFEFMIKNYNKVFSRKNLLKNIWGAENNQEIRTIDEHIKRIRRKLKEKNINNKFIKTIWGTGYKFKFEEDNDED